MQLAFEKFPSRMLSAGWVREVVPGMYPTTVLWEAALENTDATAPPRTVNYESLAWAAQDLISVEYLEDGAGPDEKWGLHLKGWMWK